MHTISYSPLTLPRTLVRLSRLAFTQAEGTRQAGVLAVVLVLSLAMCMSVVNPAHAQQQVAKSGAAEGVADGKQMATQEANQFGWALAVDGEWAFVGEPQSRFFQSNAVMVFRHDGSAWAPVDTLTGPNRGARFGAALALSGGSLYVGAPDDDGTGGVHVYTLEGDTWTWSSVVRPDPSVPGAGFGTALDVDGDLLLAGAPYENGNNGAIYTFSRQAGSGSGSTWEQQARLEGTLSGEALFGFSVTLAGEGAVVGAQYSAGRAGVAYYFKRDASTGSWTLEQEFTGSGVVSGGRFGRSVSGGPTALAVGAPAFEGGRGRIFTYSYKPSISRWVESQGLSMSGGSSTGYFGWHVALHGDRLMAGSFSNGRTQVYRVDAEVWSLEQDMAVPVQTSNVQFGYVTALSADAALVSGGNAETVYFYDRSTPQSGLAFSGSWGIESDLPSAITGGAACQDGTAAGFPCEGVDLLSFLPIEQIGGAAGTRLNDIWGWTDPATGTDYALVGRTDGTAFVDLADPREPRYVGTLQTRTNASTWRDIKVINDHAVIVADNAGSHGMQVFDLANLRNATGAPVNFQPTTVYTAFGSAHNVAVNEASGHAIAVGISGAQSVPAGAVCGPGPHLIDMSNPASPVFAGCYLPGHGRSYSHDVQCVRYNGPDTAHAGKDICVGSDEVGISVTDVSNTTVGKELSRLAYPAVAYAHQGWLTEDHRYFFLGDELDESRGLASNTRTLLFDLEDLDEPVLVGEILGASASIDHNMYTHGGLLYQANYASGLVILDLNATSTLSPQSISQVASFDVYPGDDGTAFVGAWSVYPYFDSGVVLVSGIESGLYVLKLSSNTSTAVAPRPDTRPIRPGDVRLQVYPNPSQDGVTVSFETNGTGPVRVDLYDGLGRRVRHIHDGVGGTNGPTTVRILTDGLPGGIYFVRALSAGKVVSTPLVVAR
ncbi:MAG: choice-of-anchor B family protein [Rhodothermales bacterium]